MDASFFNGSITIRAALKKSDTPLDEPTLAMITNAQATICSEKLSVISLKTLNLTDPGILCVVMPTANSTTCQALDGEWYCIVAIVVQGPVQLPYSAIDNADRLAIGQALQVKQSVGASVKLEKYSTPKQKLALIMNTNSTLQTADIIL